MQYFNQSQLTASIEPALFRCAVILSNRQDFAAGKPTAAQGGVGGCHHRGRFRERATRKQRRKPPQNRFRRPSVQLLVGDGANQRQMFQQSQQICSELRQSRWVLIEQAQNVLPMPFLVMLLFWLTALHMSFGLFAPRNAMVVIVLLICALSVSGAVFLILEMNHPLSGMIKVSSAPMLKALEHLGQ